MLTIWKKMKKKVNGFIEKLSKENEKSFGSGRLDCCQLNKNPTSKIK